MGIPAINSLANMEYMLYGGASGAGGNCPSFYNGYMTASNVPYSGMYTGYSNPSFLGNYGNYGSYGGYGNYGYNNSIYDSYNPSYQGLAQQSVSGGTTFQQGVTQEDINKLAEYYANNNALEEGFMGAATGGLSWMAFEHAQSLFHPFNAAKGVKAAEAIFKNVPKGFAKENATLMQEAYTAVQQAVRDTGSKNKYFSQWLRKPLSEAEIKPLVENMRRAVNSGNVKAIAEATEKLQAARGFDGKLIPGKKLTVAERLANKTKSGEIAKGAKNLVSIGKGGFGSLVKSCFKKDFVGFMVFESIFNAGKIFTAFQKDTKTGLKQTGQSVAKSAAATAGWCLGRAAGTWLGAKAGAAIGSLICPGAGTVVGALVGFTVGSIGMWAGHKLGNAIFGKDVADKVEAENLAKTKDGQVQLLQFAAQKAQDGNKIDARTAQAMQNVYNAYA